MSNQNNNDVMPNANDLFGSGDNNNVVVQNVKDIFDDERSCEQEGKLETENGNHRDQGVAYRVSPKSLAPAEALGSCSADVIFLNRLQYRGSCHTG